MDDRLEGHPEPLQGALEGALQAGAVVLERRVLAQHGERLALELGQAMEARRAAHDALQLGELHRLDQVAECAVLDRLQRRGQLGAAGHQHDRHVGVVLTDRAQQVDAGEPRHGDVGEDGVEPLVLDQGEGGLAVGGDIDLVPVGAESAREYPLEQLVVLGEQEARGPDRVGP